MIAIYLNKITVDEFHLLIVEVTAVDDIHFLSHFPSYILSHDG